MIIVVFMEKTSQFKGLNGNINVFKEAVSEAEKITFIGAPGVCTPFAELFAYAVRDKKSCFITLTDISSARKLELTPQGMQLSDSADPQADVVALLGGLTMPKVQIGLNELKDMIAKILNKNGKIIGLSYMGMFTESGWDKEIDFDCIIDGTLIGYVIK
jgi:hypothetical protein